jgi:hypothetical protein
MIEYRSPSFAKAATMSTNTLIGMLVRFLHYLKVVLIIDAKIFLVGFG